MNPRWPVYGVPCTVRCGRGTMRQPTGKKPVGVFISWNRLLLRQVGLVLSVPVPATAAPGGFTFCFFAVLPRQR